MKGLLFIVAISAAFYSYGETIPYQGLETIPMEKLDSWGNQFYKKTPAPDLQGANKRIIQVFNSTETVSDFYDGILALSINGPFESTESYRLLVDALFAARQKIIKWYPSRPNKVKEATLLLEFLAEESLYIAHKKAGLEKVQKFDFAESPGECADESGIERRSELHKVALCQGDIVTSKGGQASSSFIARVADYPGNFSHSTVVYVPPKTSDLYFIEAFIEDGVKLRDAKKDYIEKRKTKLFIFRTEVPAVAQKAISGVDAIYKEMTEIIGSTKIEDLMNTMSYPYDFAMDTTETKEIFCSEVPYYAYNIIGDIEPEQNPYPKKVWSSIEKPARYSLVRNFLQINTTFPAPGDIEFNENYKLVSMQFNPTRLGHDRIMIALIDTLTQLMNENETLITGLSFLLRDVGNRELSPKKIKAYLKIISEKLEIKIPEKFLEIIDRIPHRINFKQLVFFAFLNEYLERKVTEGMAIAEDQITKAGGYFSPAMVRSLIYGSITTELQELVAKIRRIIIGLPIKNQPMSLLPK